MARTKGTGGITRLEQLPKARCRKWRLVVVEDGRRRERRFTGTYAQAEAALREMREEAEKPKAADTFAEYSARWLASRDVEPQTLSVDSMRVRHLCAALGGMRLADIRRSDVQAALASIREGRNASGNRLSGTTANGVYSALRRILQEAVYDGLIDSNPAATVKPPKLDTREKSAVGVADVARMIETLDGMPLDGKTVAVRLAVLAGSRRGEVVGFEWGDVEPGYISVKRSIERSSGRAKEPKTGSGVRKIPLLPSLEAALAQWKDEQGMQLSLIGIEQTDSTPIVTTGSGTRMDAHYLYKWWRKNAPAMFGIDCTMHELRHTFLTMLANSGANAQAVKSIAGWSNISMADVYVHSDSAANADAVAALGDRLMGSRGVADATFERQRNATQGNAMQRRNGA